MWWFILYILISVLIGTICYVFWCEPVYSPLDEEECFWLSVIWPITIIFGGVYLIIKLLFIIFYYIIKKIKNELEL